MSERTHHKSQEPHSQTEPATSQVVTKNTALDPAADLLMRRMDAEGGPLLPPGQESQASKDRNFLATNYFNKTWRDVGTKLLVMRPGEPGIGQLNGRIEELKAEWRFVAEEAAKYYELADRSDETKMANWKNWVSQLVSKFELLLQRIHAELALHWNRVPESQRKSAEVQRIYAPYWPINGIHALVFSSVANDDGSFTDDTLHFDEIQPLEGVVLPTEGAG